MAFCKYCGNSIPDEAAFCPECGKKAPGGSRGASPLSQQESSAQEPLSRKEFCDMSFSPDIKKRVRTSWIAFVVVVMLRTLLCLAVIPLYGVPFDMFLTWIPRRIFNSLSLAHLLLLLSCVFHRRGLVVAGMLIGLYAYWPFVDVFDLIGCFADLVACIFILVNTNKIEKEYRAYLEHAFPGCIKSRTK